jgi:6-phosphogluconolactonase (cycloisomerase 2 family)
MPRVSSAAFLLPAVLLGIASLSFAQATQEFIYGTSNDNGTGFISAYSINSASGALALVPGSPYSLSAPTSIAVNTAGTFAYGVDDSYIPIYSINPTSGALALVGYPQGAFDAYVLVFHPSGRFAYASNWSSVFGFSVDSSTGALTPLPGTPFATAGANSQFLAVDPSGKFLYALNVASFNISVLRIDQSSGVAMAVAGSPFACSHELLLNSIVTHPAGGFLYVSDSGGEVSTFSVDSSTGTLTQIAGSPFQITGTITSMSFNPSGSYLYMAGGDVFGFSVDPLNGTFTSIPGSPFTSDGATAITVDPEGEFVYAASRSASTISGFVIEPSTGALQPVAGSPFPTATAPDWITATRAPTQTPPGNLVFPVPQSTSDCGGACTPLTVNIAAVFDHQQTAPYAKDHIVEDYTAEVGRCNPNGQNKLWSPVQVDQRGDGLFTGAWGYMQASGAFFTVNGNYTGDGATSAQTTESLCGSAIKTGTADSRLFLFYDGHPGYDYPFPFFSKLYPAINGCVSYQVAAAGDANQQQFHTLAIIPMSSKPPGGQCAEPVTSQTGYVVFYLHLASYLGEDGKTVLMCPSSPTTASPTCPNPVLCTLGKAKTPCPQEGAWVSTAEPIAYVGNFAPTSTYPNGAWHGVGPHLHFEVDYLPTPTATPVPIDPYGWYPSIAGTPDPYSSSHPGIVNNWLWQEPPPY